MFDYLVLVLVSFMLIGLFHILRKYAEPLGTTLGAILLCLSAVGFFGSMLKLAWDLISSFFR
jgi:hypothetical protein